MIEVSAIAARRKIESLITELKYVSSDTFLRSLGANRYKDEALHELTRNFPRSFSSDSNLNEFGMHLIDSFRATIDFNASKVRFSIFSVLQSNSRAATVLESLNSGSKAYFFVPDDTQHFLSKPGGKIPANQWVSLKAGKAYFRPEREPTLYRLKTELFILEHILPELRQEVVDKIAARMKRVKATQ